MNAGNRAGTSMSYKAPAITRFLYLADTHFFAAPMGYQQQKGYPELAARLLEELAAWIDEHEDTAFIMHGGDLLDQASPLAMKRAAGILQHLPIPVRLCLGNHDLTVPDAVRLWLDNAPGLFPGRAPDFTIEAAGCVVHVMPTQWEDAPWLWRERQDEHFLPAQLARLDAELARRPDLPHILVTHGPVFGVPPAQTGFDAPYHGPGAAFTAACLDLVRRHACIRCVLGAHTHLNMQLEHDGVRFVTASSFVEAPFEFKVFEVSPEGISMETVPLASRLDALCVDYDFNRTYVQGRPADRSFSLRF